MLEVLGRGVKRGDLRRGAELALALDVLNGPMFYRFLFTGEPIDAALARRLVDVVLRGFAPLR